MYWGSFNTAAEECLLFGFVVSFFDLISIERVAYVNVSIAGTA